MKDRCTLGPGKLDKKEVRILPRVITRREATSSSKLMFTLETVEKLGDAYGIRPGGSMKATPLDNLKFPERHSITGAELRAGPSRISRSAA